MAYDAGMLACAASEIRRSALGGRVEKVFQPERDEIIIQLRTTLGGRRILINAGSNNPRLCYSALAKENPAVPPGFCMLLRKHLNGAKLGGIVQQGFERSVWIAFECRDEMGFECTKYLIAEVMGKYSNLIFTDGEMRIIGVLRPVDFTTSSRRQVLPGMKYELPPAQDKSDPTVTEYSEFAAAYEAAAPEQKIEKFITNGYLGISAAVAREMVYRATRHTDTPVKYCGAEDIWREFSVLMGCLREERFSPTLVTVDGKLTEYSFIDLSQYGAGAERRHFESAGELLDVFFGERDRDARIKQRAGDILRIVSAAEARTVRKLENQRGELTECGRGEEYKRDGDLITSNMHAIEKGVGQVLLTDYSDMREDGSFGQRAVKLNPQLTPAENAQRYYKKYNKAKHAKVELTRQIALGEAELDYLRSVLDSLDRAETSDDLAEIRDELYRSGYASKMKGYAAPKKISPAVMRFVTDGGYTVLCGRNNMQNEHITHQLAERNDYWFHVKGRPGSHAVLLTGGREPGELDFTQAARIAALYSSGKEGQNLPVDYTRVKNLKKTPGGKPGLVIYHTNWTAYVTPDPAEAARLRVGKK